MEVQVTLPAADPRTFDLDLGTWSPEELEELVDLVGSSQVALMMRGHLPRVGMRAVLFVKLRPHIPGLTLDQMALSFGALEELLSDITIDADFEAEIPMVTG